MAWTIPDKGEGFSQIQSQCFQEYLEVLLTGLDGRNCVLSGCGVTAQGSPDMTLAVAKGAVLTAGVLKPVTAGNVTISAADSANPRIDLVVVDSSGAKAVRAGTPATFPKPPTRTTDDIVLAAVFVPATDTTLENDKVTDMRVIRTKGPIEIAKTTTAVTFNTTLAIQNYFSVVIPNGLFLAGRQIRVRCGGNYLSNSGTPTWTLTVSYGGTTIFADVTVATTADADRGAWLLEFTINASGNAVQQTVGHLSFQTPGTKAVPTTGTAGDMAVTTDQDTVFRGAGTIDSDAADRTLLVQWTMSVSNAAVETVMDFATAELI